MDAISLPDRSVEKNTACNLWRLTVLKCQREAMEA
jgi:hypothetical protein